ncbi:MAG TPA: hypothetical protein VN181_07765, partial [Thermoanaerobaculia bacterium]|nr:hypothetical protein [Thermoanaerobaculia bacterium]
VLFLCPHGGAKSVIAATYFNELAAARGLSITATAAAAEDAYAEVPAVVADALCAEGFDVSEFRPHHAGASEVESASRIVTIDCDASTIPQARVVVEEWNDVPKVSDDLAGSIAAIRLHVVQLIDDLSR